MTLFCFSGVDAVYRELLSHTRALLQSFPLSAHFMEKHHGLRGVLVCGPKGCGKSTITRAICRALAEQTPLAHITVIDCKPLRGLTLFLFIYLVGFYLTFYTVQQVKLAIFAATKSMLNNVITFNG